MKRQKEGMKRQKENMTGQKDDMAGNGVYSGLTQFAEQTPQKNENLF